LKQTRGNGRSSEITCCQVLLLTKQLRTEFSTVIPDELTGLVEQLLNLARTIPSDIKASCPEHTFTAVSDSDLIEVQTGIFVIIQGSILTLSSNQPPALYVPRAVFTGVKRLGSEVKS
jgi:hypothetical protein